mgnify:FL=1
MGQLYIAKMNWNNALDFVSLQSISSVEKLEWHHIFPQSLWNDDDSPLLGVGLEDEDKEDLEQNRNGYMNHFANKTYISKSSNAHIGATEPATYLRTIDSKRREVLTAHDLDDPKYFDQDEYREFLKSRRKKINRSIVK